MAIPVTDKGQRVARQFNKYLKYRKMVEKSGTSFTEQIAGAAKKGDLNPVAKLPARGDRKNTPTRFAPPQFSSKPKPISLRHAQRLAKYAPIIQDAAAKHNVPVELICGVILQESGGQAEAKSHAGAKGLMQLMPATARRFGVKNIYDPVQNIHGGTKYLRFLMDRFKGNIELVLAGYNAGEGAVEKHGNKIPPYRETQNYVPSVLAYTQSMINILASHMQRTSDTRIAALPSHARRV